MATTTIIEEETKNETFERKLELVTADLQPYYSRILVNPPKEISSVIIDYLLAMKTEKNLALHSREVIIKTLTKLATFCNFKDWKAYSRADNLAFLDTFRKTDASDTLHKWIGTYNLYRNVLMPFFKWLYHPELKSEARPKPACVDNIPQLKRKETSIYKATDLWTPQDDLLFLKYCPSKRDRCYHAISRDLSARPAEILNLKIKDVHFKLTSNNSAYAEVVVNGKTGQRHIPLINSIPFLKDWCDESGGNDPLPRMNQNPYFLLL